MAGLPRSLASIAGPRIHFHPTRSPASFCLLRRMSWARKLDPPVRQLGAGATTQLPAAQLSQAPHATGVPVHKAAVQVSPVVQASPSSHGLAFGVNAQPVAGTQASLVHGLPSLHTGGAPGWQVPLPGLQVSSPLQALPSLHTIGVPGTQPAAGAQVSTPLHGLPSLQVSGVPPWHVPVVGLHVSTPLQTLPSLHTIG